MIAAKKMEPQLPDLSAYPPMLTVAQAAEIAGYRSVEAFRRLYRSGALACTRIALPGAKRPRVRISKAALLSFLRTCTTGGSR